jgi:hypothetical protein
MRLNFSYCVSSYCPRACKSVARELAAVGARCERDSMVIMLDRLRTTAQSLIIFPKYNVIGLWV